jgi:hypothetical protein
MLRDDVLAFYFQMFFKKTGRRCFMFIFLFLFFRFDFTGTKMRERGGGIAARSPLGHPTAFNIQHHRRIWKFAQALLPVSGRRMHGTPPLSISLFSTSSTVRSSSSYENRYLGHISHLISN